MLSGVMVPGALKAADVFEKQGVVEVTEREHTAPRISRRS